MGRSVRCAARMPPPRDRDSRLMKPPGIVAAHSIGSSKVHSEREESRPGPGPTVGVRGIIVSP